MRYEQKSGRHLLTQWRLDVWNPEGEVQRSSTSTVRDVSLNAPIPHVEFQLVFPKGTYVGDLDKMIVTKNSAQNRSSTYFKGVVAFLLLIVVITVVLVRRRITWKG